MNTSPKSDSVTPISESEINTGMQNLGIHTLMQEKVIPNFKEYISCIPSFSGENSDIGIDEFLDRVNEIAKYANWEEKHIIFVTKIKLTGIAYAFIRSQPQLQKIESFQEFQKALKNRFRKPEKILSTVLTTVHPEKIPNFKDYIPYIPPFSGEGSNIEIEDFLDRVNEVAMYAGWEENHTIFVTKIKLIGNAATFLRSQPQLKKIENLQEFHKVLKNRFTKSGNDKSLELFTAVQGANESVREFLSRLLGVSHLIFTADDEFKHKMVIDQFRAGVKPSIRNFALLRNPKNIDEAWDHAMRLEYLPGEESTSVNTTSAETNSDGLYEPDFSKLTALILSGFEGINKKLDNLAEELRKLSAAIGVQHCTDTAEQNDSSDSENFFGHVNSEYGSPPIAHNHRRRRIVCYNCDQVGHISRNCRFPPKYENNYAGVIF